MKIGLEGEKEFKRSLSEINSAFKVLGSEMKLNPGSARMTVLPLPSTPGSDSGWGKLKSGAGWIALDYAKRV